MCVCVDVVMVGSSLGHEALFDRRRRTEAARYVSDTGCRIAKQQLDWSVRGQEKKKKLA